MKKVLFTICAIGLVALMSSCSKESKCKAKVNGEVKFETTIDKPEERSCSDIKDIEVNIPGLIDFDVDCHAVLF